MEPYINLSGNSGVAAFEIMDDSITVRFKDGGKYLYTYWSAGAEHVERMKTLAANGNGLNSYINKHVKKKYASKS